MKAKTYFRLAAVLFVALGLTFTSCKKDNESEPETDTNSMSQLSKDESNIQATDDDVLNDVNNVLSNAVSKSANSLPCNSVVSVDSVVNDTLVYHITFNGLNCNGTVNRTGNVDVKVNVNTPWINAGTKVLVKLINLTVTKVSTNKTVVLNGTKIFENVSGGKLEQLGNGVTSIVHKVSGSMQATFDDNSVRTWNIARERTFTGTSGQYICTVAGFGSSNSYDNLVVWGTNRNGEAFYTQINTPVVFKEACGWKPCSGVKVHQIPSDSKKATVTFGFDNANQPTTDCPTKCKVDWEKNGHNGTIFFEI